MEGFHEESRRSVLILEDDEQLISDLRYFLEDEGWSVECAGTVAEARTKISENVFDLVLADYRLPDANGLSVFEEIVGRSPLTKVMLMTGVRDMKVARLALQKGVVDLLPKPFGLPELQESIDRSMDQKRQQLERDLEQSRAADCPKFREIIGQSRAIKKVLQLVEAVARTNVTVLITGASGTGKELIARAVHQRSHRSKAPFVAINCGAIPENLLEDELFGHVRGAYTDAKGSRSGRFEQANGGTLFLDEIGNMSVALQVKLLRVLEEKEFERLGSNQKVEVDVRVVAATNCDLDEKVRTGEFREDLFYRLNVAPVRMPSLQDRRDDIPLLVHHFLSMFSEHYDLGEKQVDPAALKKLAAYSWPGNIRELRNVIELVSVLAGERSIMTAEDFAALDTAGPSSASNNSLDTLVELPEEGIDLNQVVSEVEKNLICQSLKRTGGNKGKAARLLFLKRTTLVEKLRRMDLLHEFS
jgi:DNA-binding NtrC family response regulator